MEVGAGSSSSTAPPGGGDCSSCSGTLSSTTTTVGSPSSSSSGLHPPGMELDAEARASKLSHLKGLLQEFCRNCDCNTALERWFSEMDADWILHLAGHDDAAAARRSIVLVSPQLPHLARRWILALGSIKKSIFAFIHGLCSEEEEEDDNDTTTTTSVEPIDDAHQPTLAEFSRFIESTISKMLPFVDAIVALRSSSSSEHIVTASETKLEALVPVRDALFTASEEIQFWPRSCSLSFRLLERIVDEMSDLLSSKLGELDKAIWDTTDEIRMGIMDDDDGGAVTFLSPDIHELTRSVTTCIKLLDTNHVLFSRIAYEAAQLGTFVPETRDILPLTSLVMEMLSNLEGKLAAMSRAFQHHSLRFLFSINNSHFIWQQLHLMFDMRFRPMAALARKIDEYIQSYLQVSWGPVLSCLHHDPRPLLCLRLGRRYSPLPDHQFQSEFHRVYATQRLWKVPDPEMRARLRKAVANMIASGLQDNSDTTTTPRVTPGELEEMLQELFEG